MSDNNMPKIAVSGLTKSFKAAKGGQLPVIQGVDFEVAEGEFVAIVGPSGCGKSTLMNILAGFEKAAAGGWRIGGAPHPGWGGAVVQSQTCSNTTSRRRSTG